MKQPKLSRTERVWLARIRHRGTLYVENRWEAIDRLVGRGLVARLTNKYGVQILRVFA
jgi:hypothetical protein